MRLRKLLGLLLIAGGVLALVYGGFNYTKNRHELRIAGVELGVAKKERVNVPVWAGVAAVFSGAVLLAVGKR
jgi:uncharacterized membrane protein YidH (DUF202 family)